MNELDLLMRSPEELWDMVLYSDATVLESYTIMGYAHVKAHAWTRIKRSKWLGHVIWPLLKLLLLCMIGMGNGGQKV